MRRKLRVSDGLVPTPSDGRIEHLGDGVLRRLPRQRARRASLPSPCSHGLRHNAMALVILRCVFLAVAIALAFQIATSEGLASEHRWLPWAAFVGVIVAAIGVLIADIAIRRKRLDTITAVYFGTIIGLFLSYVFQLALSPLLPQGRAGGTEWADWAKIALATIVCYTCISVLLQ